MAKAETIATASLRCAGSGVWPDLLCQPDRCDTAGRSNQSADLYGRADCVDLFLCVVATAVGKDGAGHRELVGQRFDRLFWHGVHCGAALFRDARGMDCGCVGRAGAVADDGYLILEEGSLPTAGNAAGGGNRGAEPGAQYFWRKLLC